MNGTALNTLIYAGTDLNTKKTDQFYIMAYIYSNKSSNQAFMYMY